MHQLNIPFAEAYGKKIEKIPKNIYIPEEYLDVSLNSFTGPLDLLLYLIRINQFNILDIPIFEITKQYRSYIQRLKMQNFEQISDYLLIAALLTEIKTKTLLPEPDIDDDIEEDPRSELVSRLRDFGNLQQIANVIEQNLIIYRSENYWLGRAIQGAKGKEYAKIEQEDFANALLNILTRKKLSKEHKIATATLEIKDKIVSIIRDLKKQKNPVEFYELINKNEGLLGIVTVFSAILELLQQNQIELWQESIYSPIKIKSI